MKILALDLGKFKSVACVYVAGTSEHSFETIRTEYLEVGQLVDKVKPNRVVIEISPLAGWVGDLVREQAIELQVANTNGAAWSWRHVKRKTDRLDALKLAQMSAMNQLPLVHLPEPKVREWRALIEYRQSLVGRRTRIKNRIRAILDRMGVARLPASKMGWTDKALAELRERARSLEKCRRGEYWRGELSEELGQLDHIQDAIARVEVKLDGLAQKDKRVQRLRTIPGVGPRLAEMVVAVIDDPHRFKRGKQIGSYIGLTPRQYQSGTMDRQGRISGHGHKHLRSMLVEVAWLGLRYNPWMRDLYQRVHRDSPARKKIAIVAVARRLLIRCWAMLRDETRWQGPPLARMAGVKVA
jgi:transposase